MAKSSLRAPLAPLTLFTPILQLATPNLIGKSSWTFRWGILLNVDLIECKIRLTCGISLLGVMASSSQT